MKHDELSLREPVFVATLPFDEIRVPRYITERVLHHTRRSWQWFIDAQTSNPVLGTLGYLPHEVRRMILEELLHCRPTLSSDGLWEYNASLGPVFNLGAYCFGFGRRTLLDIKVQNLRMASSALKREYEDVFLTGRTFRFNYGPNLGAFTDGLASLGRERPVRRIEIAYGVFSVQLMEDFVQPMSNLWRKLRDVDILIYPFSSSIFERKGRESALIDLSKTIEGAAKSAPEARITIYSINKHPLSSECEAVIKATLERITIRGTHRRLDNSIVPTGRRDWC